MSTRNRQVNRFHISIPEELEARAMLAGHGGPGGGLARALAGAAAFQAASHHAAAQFSAANFSANANVLDEAFAESGSHCGGGEQTVLTTTATDATSGESATFTARSKTYDGETETQLTVNVTGAAASSSLDVTVNGEVVGTLATDANGAGSVRIKDLTQTFEDGVTTVGVGTLTGTLALSTTSTSDDSSSTVTVRRASLTDANSGAAAAVKYKAITSSDGTTSSKLVVRVTGAVASSPLDVAIDGTSVGTLETDANGAGKLVLRDLAVAVTDTSTVTVGTMSGTLELVTTHQAAGWRWHRWF